MNELELDPSLTDTQPAVLLELVRRPKATYNGLAEIDGRDGHFDVERRVKRLEVLDFTGYRPIDAAITERGLLKNIFCTFAETSYRSLPPITVISCDAL